jgi:hypothetical protein
VGKGKVEHQNTTLEGRKMTTWIQYARQLYKIEQKYYPKILKALNAYIKQFNQDLKRDGLAAAHSNLSLQSFNTELQPIVQDLYKRVGLWGAKTAYSELKELATEGAKAGGFGRNEQWIADVIKYLAAHALRLIQKITNTTREDILRILQNGIDNNLTIDQVIQELSGAGIVETRARTIARTEIVRAANVGHQVGARSFPYEVNKKWKGAGDHRERHSHRLLNDYVIGEDDLFKVPVYKGDKPTGEFDEMNAPGDPTASAANTINCRCRVTYIPKRDEKGRLIMREQNQAVVIPMRSVPQTPIEQIAAALKAAIIINVEK